MRHMLQRQVVSSTPAPPPPPTPSKVHPHAHNLSDCDGLRRRQKLAAASVSTPVRVHIVLGAALRLPDMPPRHPDVPHRLSMSALVPSVSAVQHGPPHAMPLPTKPCPRWSERPCPRMRVCNEVKADACMRTLLAWRGSVVC